MIPQPPKDDPRVLVVDDIDARRVFYDETRHALEKQEEVIVIDVKRGYEPSKDVPQLANNRKERRAYGSNKKRRLFRP